MEPEIIKYPHIHGVSFTENGIPDVFPPHWHNAAEFIIVLKNGCRYKIDGRIYEPESGDILLVWPRELHEVLHIPKNGLVFIQFSSYLIDSNSDFASASHFLNASHLISGRKNPLLTAKIKDFIYKIKRLQTEQNYFSETRCKLLVYEILLLLGEFILSEYQHSLGDGRFSHRLWEYIRFACSYIAEHSAEKLTQAQVAQKTGLSQYYFSKLFNEYTKMSFPAYLAGIRVQNAINLLQNENLSITHCAFEAGFQSSTTFNKVFLEHTGISPREYRKMRSKNRQEP